MAEVFKPYQLPEQTIKDVTSHLANSSKLDEFLMKFYHGEQQPEACRARKSAFTIAFAYLAGGAVPLTPYMWFESVLKALYVSFVLMAIALFAFGYVKTCAVVGWGERKNIRAGCFGGMQMVLVGGLAAASAMGFVKFLSPN